VRQRASALVALISDRDRLNEERERAAKTAGKFGGVSSTQARYGSYSGPSGGYSGGAGGGYSGGQDYGSERDGGGRYGGAGSSSFGSSASSSARAAGRPAALSAAVPVAAVAAAAEEDPVEATRRRIARLKAEGALPESPGARGAGTAAGAPNLLDEPSSGLVDTPPAKKAPKKLSDVRVNPAVAASLGKLAPPTARSAAPSAASGIDLLGDLMSVPAAPLSSSAAAVGGDWDTFSAAPAAAGSSGGGGGTDGWAAFEGAALQQPQVQQQRQQQDGGLWPNAGGVDITSLLSVPGPSTAGAPLPADAFAHFSAGAPATAPLSGPAGLAPSSDPFSASTGMTPALAPGGGLTAHAAAAHRQQPKLGPDTVRAKDPFADLGVF
jgi:epsin